jgi:hypothetical protein
MKKYTLSLPIYTEKEFLDVVSARLIVDNDSLIEFGFPKWNRDHASEFFEYIFLRMSENFHYEYIVDIGNKEVVWLVSGPRSMLVNKKKTS